MMMKNLLEVELENAENALLAAKRRLKPAQARLNCLLSQLNQVITNDGGLFQFYMIQSKVSTAQIEVIDLECDIEEFEFDIWDYKGRLEYELEHERTTVQMCLTF